MHVFSEGKVLLAGTGEPLHEMLSMKLPAELFTGTGKTRKKETVAPSFFDCLGSGADAPFWQLKVGKALRRSPQTELTFMK